MKKLRILLIGAAFSADLHSDAYSRIQDKMHIVGICDKDLNRVQALAERYSFFDYAAYDDYNTAIAECDCDLVDICMPNFLHHDVAIKALTAGRNIICEKPLATTVEDAQDIVDTANRLGKHIYYAEDWLFSPAIRKALQTVEQGAIGKPVFIRARECHCGSHSPFAQKIQYCGGGSMIHLGIHPIGLMLSLKNNEWTELCAMTSGGGENNLVHRSMEGEDWAAVSMKFSDGTAALLEGNYVTTGGMEDVIDIYGTEGCLHIDLTFTSAIKCYSIPGLDYTVEKAEITTGWSRPAVDEKFNLGYVKEIEYFVECCGKGIDADTGMRGKDGLEALRVIDCIYRSAREGRTIKNLGFGR